MTFIHPLETKLQKSFDGLGVVDLEVPKFADLNNMQNKSSTVRKTVATQGKKIPRYTHKNCSRV